MNLLYLQFCFLSPFLHLFVRINQAVDKVPGLRFPDGLPANTLLIELATQCHDFKLTCYDCETLQAARRIVAGEFVDQRESKLLADILNLLLESQFPSRKRKNVACAAIRHSGRSKSGQQPC